MSWPVLSGCVRGQRRPDRTGPEQTLETKREAGISLKLEIPSKPMSVVP